MTKKETDRLDKKKSSRKLQKTKFNIELWHLKSKVFNSDKTESMDVRDVREFKLSRDNT